MIDNKKLDLTITRLTKSEDLPFDLLLLADETVAAIEKYIYDSGVYVVKTGAYPHPIAVFVLQKIDDNEIEIKNIAVAETFQDKGIGSYMIGEIKRIALAANYRRIIVGTPDHSARQINFYQRNGFRKFAIRKNFFIENYPQPIIENGSILRDMVMLRMNL
jgi:ribosomal protein S18 acetylase RimI-like enzyme